MNPTVTAAWRASGRKPSRGATAGFVVSLLLMAAVLVLAPAGASAAAPPGFVGLQSWDHPGKGRLDELKSAKVTTYRIQLSWASVERVRGEYRWDRYDRLFKQAADRNIRMIPVLLGSPAWVSSEQQDPPTSKGERKAFYAFAKAAADRYGPTGTYWPDVKLDGKKVGARYFQTWNEPNLKNYWNGRPNAREYARMVRGTHEAVITGDRSATTILGGVPDSNQGIDPFEFIRGMFRADPTIYSVFSAASVHAYASTPSKAIDLGVGGMRRTLNGLKGGRNKEIFVTEIGWATGKPDGKFQVSESQQARNFESFYNGVRSGTRADTDGDAHVGFGPHKVLGAVWFSQMDRGGADWWAERTGLLRFDGRKKPSWYRLLCVTGAKGCRR